MTHLAALLLALAVPAADEAKKPPEPVAKITFTAPVACLHCEFGEGEGCAACLKLDDKTPVLLKGKGAESLHDLRFSKAMIVAEGALAVSKDKKLVLTVTSARPVTDKDKGVIPEPGEVRLNGTSCCGKCDLNVCSVCTVAIRNGETPIVLSGKLAEICAEGDKPHVVVGKPFVDKAGVLRVEAKKLEEIKATSEKPAK